ncbi:MAG: hypothetical protein AB1941_24495 [Gemmatimonadota bacterium]
MFLPVLDVILGLVFVYLILSLACTALNEVIAQWLNWRARTLRQGLRTLLAGDAKATALYDHPIIKGLSQARWGLKGRVHLPSYIPSRAFSTALLDMVVPADSSGPKTLRQTRAAVADPASGLPDGIRKPLLLFIDEAGGDIAKVRLRLEQWYEDSMERVSGLYKRKTQAMILLIAAVVTVMANADTIRIGRALASDAALRSAVVAQAQAMASNPSADLRELLRLDSIRAAETRRRAQVPADTTGGTAAPDTTPAARVAADSAAAFRLRQVRASIDSLQAMGVPLGWQVPDTTRKRIDAIRDSGERRQAWLGFYASGVWRGLPGLLLTMLAISLGAPFWFDMLNKIINVRSAGRAPEERPKNPEALPPPRGA